MNLNLTQPIQYPSKVKLIDHRSECNLLKTYIQQKGCNRPLKILEAGCGKSWPIKLDGISYEIVGIDIDQDGLELRQRTVDDLDKYINGDLRYIYMEDNQYDVIYNSFVLEHIDGAEKVLDNFNRWLKHSGILILKIPDRDSIFGLITRLTPFWFHVIYKKIIMGHQDAGKPGYGPFPTYYDKVVSRKGIHEFCRQNNFLIKEEFGRGFGYYKNPKTRGFKAILQYSFMKIASIVSFGKLSGDYTSLLFILEKGH